MSDSDDPEDLAAIRQRKMAELRSAGDRREPVHVDDEAHFEELVADHDVVLVDFHADWCGPCQMLEPVVGAIAQEMPVTVAKVDVDDQEGLARQYSVQGVPTLLLFVDGEREERLVGVQDEATLFELIERHV